MAFVNTIKSVNNYPDQGIVTNRKPNFFEQLFGLDPRLGDPLDLERRKLEKEIEDAEKNYKQMLKDDMKNIKNHQDKLRNITKIYDKTKNDEELNELFTDKYNIIKRKSPSSNPESD